MDSGANTSSWKKGSVGEHMTNRVPSVPQSFTLDQTRKHIEKNVNEIESMDYIYVLDENKRLVNIISSKILFSLPKKTKLASLVPKIKLISISPDANQEHAAYLSLQHNLSTIPVVDKENVFLGVVTKHKILQLLHKKHLEDTFRVAGVHKSHAQFDNIFDISIFQSFKHRIIWLIIGLLGGVTAAKIISLFESVLNQNIVLAAFIPLVVYVGGAVLTQLEAFVIRDFALFKKIDFGYYLIKQFAIVFTMAITIGLISFLITLPFIAEPLPLILGIAVFCAITSSIFTGLLIPFIFRKFKADPVNGSGPIGTIIQDLLSVIIYFAVASAML